MKRRTHRCHLRFVIPLIRNPLTRLTLIIAVALTSLHAGNLSPRAESTAADKQAPTGGDARTLTRGQSVMESLGGGGSHVYEIYLAKDQYLSVLVYKTDFNLSATFFGPDNQQRMDFVSRGYGPLQAAFVAESSGSYHLEISSLEKDFEARRYELRVEDVRNATARDSASAGARGMFAEAEALRSNWDRQSLQEAIKNYTEAGASWESINERREAALAFQSVGDVHFILSEYRQALNFYVRALSLRRATKDRRAELETLNSIGYVYIYLGENYRALNFFGKVLDDLKSFRQPNQDVEMQREHARALNNIGETYYSLSNLPKALDYLKKALALWEELSDRRAQALAHLNIGYTYADSGDPQDASEHYFQSLSLWQAVGDRRGEALTNTAIGGVRSLLGEKQSAFDFHKRAMQLFRVIGNYQGEAAALNGIAQVYEDLNQPDLAFDNYNGALRLYEQIGNRDYVALNWYYLGRVYYSVGKSEQARDFFERSVQLSRQVGDKRVEAHALQGLGKVYESLGHKERALDEYNQVLKLYQHSGDQRWQARTLNSIGYIYYSSGKTQRALSYYEQALALSRAVEEWREEISTYYNMACVERDRGRFDEALSHIAASIDLIESLRTKVVSEDLRTSYFASVHQHYELYTDLLMQLHKRNPDKGYAVTALQASERARARSLLEDLTAERINLQQGVSPELLEHERALQQQLDLKLEYQTRVLNGNHTDAQATELAREVRDLMARYQDLRSDIRRQSPRYAILTQPELLRVEDIQSELRDDDTLLLEYTLGSQRSYLWAVTPASVTVYELPGRAEIEDLAGRVYSLLTARQPVDGEKPAQYRERVSIAEAGYWQEAAELSRVLFGQVATQFRAKRLLIVCDGALQYIPFEALPRPEPAEAGEGRSLAAEVSHDGDPVPLLMEHEIVRLPSASVLAALRREESAARPPSKLIAILADPVFDKYDSRIHTPSNPAAKNMPESDDTELNCSLRDAVEEGGDLTIPRLPSTSREAKAIMGLIPAGEGMLATDFKANRAVVMSGELSNYRIVHFATHGIFNNEHPELSGIVLSLVDENGSPQNGFLRIHDLYNLHLPADLVVLSACRTGLGRNVTGEGIIGIARGFMCAGTKTIVASLWKVNDEATEELMKNFYNAMLKDGLPPSAALRAAKINMWQQERWRSPYFWGSFVLQGEYSKSFVQANESHREVWLRLSAVSLVILVIGGYFLRWASRAGRRN